MGLKANRLLSKMIITLLLLTVSTVVSAGSVWDGSVSVARYGYLPQTGMYAASNAFPQNTRVTVTNPDTGKSVDVIVLERLEDNDLFLVLSFDAAESVGIGYGDIFHGTISKQVAAGPGTESDLPYNPDPDINPAALSGEYSELALIQEYIDTELGGVDESLIIPDTEVEQEVPEPVELIEDIITDVEEPIEEISDPVLVAEPVEAEDETDIPLVENIPHEDVYNDEPDDVLPIPDLVEVTSAEEPVENDIPLIVGMSTSVPSEIVASADIRDNIPGLPVPEDDRPVITSMGVEILEEAETEIAISELPELPIIEVEEVLSDEKPVAVSMTADVIEIEELEDISSILPLVEEFIAEEPDMEDEVVVAVTEPVIDLPPEDELLMDVEVVLEPSDLRPPVVDTVEETEVVDTVVEEISSVSEPVEEMMPAAATYNMTRVLAEDSYYLQLGAYREQYSALDLADSLGGMYPVTVFISDSPDTFNYKVMVGPLGQDESGAIMYSFRSSGYPDAFLRKGL
ncbi:MAG: SPOR domain-containing protein [Spirochaetales bacterium]|nr:SPOR domain-containing protein [Spirochaetales bacterium]